MNKPDPTARESTPGIRSPSVFTQAAVESFTKNTTLHYLVRCYRAMVHINNTRLQGAMGCFIWDVQAIHPDCLTDRVYMCVGRM